MRYFMSTRLDAFAPLSSAKLLASPLKLRIISLQTQGACYATTEMSISVEIIIHTQFDFMLDTLSYVPPKEVAVSLPTLYTIEPGPAEWVDVWPRPHHNNSRLQDTQITPPARPVLLDSRNIELQQMHRHPPGVKHSHGIICRWPHRVRLMESEAREIRRLVEA